MTNTIENAVYRAICSTVSSAIGISKMLGDIKGEIQKGRIIEMDCRVIAESTSKYANEHFRRAGKARIEF